MHRHAHSNIFSLFKEVLIHFEYLAWLHGVFYYCFFNSLLEIVKWILKLQSRTQSATHELCLSLSYDLLLLFFLSFATFLIKDGFFSNPFGVNLLKVIRLKEFFIDFLGLLILQHTSLKCKSINFLQLLDRITLIANSRTQLLNFKWFEFPNPTSSALICSFLQELICLQILCSKGKHLIDLILL